MSRAVRVDPGHGPGEVSPDPGPTPGQAYEVSVPGVFRPPPPPPGFFRDARIMRNTSAPIRITVSFCYLCWRQRWPVLTGGAVYV